MKRILTLSLFLLTALWGSHAESFQFGTSVNPSGRTFEVDTQGFIVDGKHVLPVMGEIHYTRVPQSEWRNELRKMKAGGITMVSTYVFWIHHEEEEGVWDWSGNRNLRAFVQTCAEEQLPLVLRIGPFCHGEVYQGGFPDWLVSRAQSDARQYKLRSLAPGFMQAVDRLFSNIFAQVNDLLWKHGGPIVGVQIENECRGPWPYYAALKEMAVRIGFDVPFYTRTGWPKLNGKEVFGEMLPLYGDYADGFWDRKLTDMPGEYAQAFVMKDTRLSGVIATETFGSNQDTRMESKDLQYPYLTCELGGGMQVAYHRRINMSGNEPFPLAVCKVGSGSNLPGYYMYHGGTNPLGRHHTMGECQASTVTNYNDVPLRSYDFQSPLGEMGQLNAEAFHQTRWLHQMLADWGEMLSQMGVDSLSEHYARRGCFIFRNDYVRILHEEGVASVTVDNLPWEGLHISSASMQPFALADDTFYFIGVKGEKKFQLTVDGRRYAMTPDKARVIAGKRFLLLSPSRARAAFVIDGKMHYASHPEGILYPTAQGIVEEYWESGASVDFTQVQAHQGLREVKMGSQKVAEMPYDADFARAAVFEIALPESLTEAEPLDNAFLEIAYQGDCARLYADGVLVEDNFWNGKPMLVRVSELMGKHLELRILPLGKDYPIYLQKEQRAVLESAPEGILCQLNSVMVRRRCAHES